MFKSAGTDTAGRREGWEGAKMRVWSQSYFGRLKNCSAISDLQLYTS